MKWDNLKSNSRRLPTTTPVIDSDAIRETDEQISSTCPLDTARDATPCCTSG
jgi:hypothetical protein